MISVIVNAYACSPNMGSEPGMAWNWCVNLANYCNLYIITEGEFRDKIEAVLPTLPQCKNMHFFYNPVSQKVRKMCWNQGDWRFYYYYSKWQNKSLDIAQNIVANNHIDIIHHLNMVGFREPGCLWELNIPYVWGPTNAKEKFPVAYLKGASLKDKMKMRMKNIINVLQLKYSIKVKYAIKHSNYVVAASSDSLYSINKYFNCNSVMINETGYTVPNFNFYCKNFEKQKLRLLWVGRLNLFTKMVPIAIDSLAKTKNENIELHFLGNGNTLNFKKIADKFNVSSQCYWHGAVPHDKVLEMMRESDLLFFTSVAEGTPHVVLEALGNRLPVICFDTCGQGDVINNEVGIKIPLSNPEKSANDFAKVINHLYNHRDEIKTMSDNCIVRAKELSWDNKAKQMVEIYKGIIR